MGVLPDVQWFDAAVRPRAEDSLKTSRRVAIDGFLSAPLAAPGRNPRDEDPGAIAPPPKEVHLDRAHLAPAVAPHGCRLLSVKSLLHSFGSGR